MDQVLTDISRKASEAGLDAGQTAGIQAQVQKIRDIAAKNNNGTIPGNVYVNLTKRGESLDQNTPRQPQHATSGQLGGQIRDALDDGLQRSASPADAAALQQARTQYKALKTVRAFDPASRRGWWCHAIDGEIRPAALLGFASISNITT